MPDADRAARMKEHFAQVSVIHAAIVRGDLAAVREPAMSLAEQGGPKELPPGTAPHVATMRRAAKSAAEARDISTAAAATASMFATCGDCHRASGIMPAAAPPARPEIGGAVGHMLDHQRALDKMLQGLVVPSNALWHGGAEELRAAPLQVSELPPDAKFTWQLEAAEERAHQLADEAARAGESSARVSVYGRMLATCADCHSLHTAIWGPFPQ
jgi:cytochrome c553